MGNVLKPDIAAPGVNILAQGYDPSATGEAANLATARPPVPRWRPGRRRRAALLKQIHPDWSPACIKSALMTTSKYMDIFTHTGAPAQPLDMGAGRLDLTNAADPGVILDPPSLSFGVVTYGETKTIEVKLTSVASAAETYAISTVNTEMGFGSLTTVDGMTVEPLSVTLAPARPEHQGHLGHHQDGG